MVCLEYQLLPPEPLTGGDHLWVKNRRLFICRSILAPMQKLIVLVLGGYMLRYFVVEVEVEA